MAFAVKDADPVRRELHHGHHGPILLREGDRAYALACPYLDEVGFTEQFCWMCLARDLDEFRSAVAFTLRAVGADEEDGVYYGNSGQSWTQAVLFRKDAVESYSSTPYGQSDHPDSPHYFDRGEKLFSTGKLKPTWFQQPAFEGHLESRTTLRCGR